MRSIKLIIQDTGNSHETIYQSLSYSGPIPQAGDWIRFHSRCFRVIAVTHDLEDKLVIIEV